MKRLCLTASLIALATTGAATPSAAAQDDKPLSETCPDLSAEEIDAIENYQGEFSENALYARAYCVSVEEAERRMAIQLRGAVGPRTEPGAPPPPPEDDMGTIASRVMQNESATFAGHWIEHTPEYRVVFAFTRDAAATLAKYTSDPLYKAVERPGPTKLELRAAQ